MVVNIHITHPENLMPREQAPGQQQYQKNLNPDNLETDDDVEDSDDTELDGTQAPPVEGERRLARDEREQRPDDNIEQLEDDEAEDDEDESDAISQRP